MIRAGGTLAFCAGVFGVLAALRTLETGGAERARTEPFDLTVSLIGLGELAFSFPTAIVGALTISPESGNRAFWLW